MKLQLLVPQWNEDEIVVKNLLNSIETQQGIDLKEIGVVIMNDGSDIILSDDFLSQYPFQIDYYLSEHKGVSAMRNQCLMAAQADYIMFCDADDMFLNNCGIYLIFQQINKQEFDVMVSTFSEEQKIDNGYQYINHINDTTFVHGKVYRREYLLENNIFWNNKLTVHEDSYFNYLARVCTKEERILYCNEVFYLWKYRENSICRNDKKYLLKTLDKMIDSTEALTEELLRRGKLKEASQISQAFIYSSYYDMNKEEWNLPENVNYLTSFMKRFKDFYKKYSKVAELCDDNTKRSLLLKYRQDKTKEGLMFEKICFNDWIKQLELY